MIPGWPKAIEIVLWPASKLLTIAFGEAWENVFSARFFPSFLTALPWMLLDRRRKDEAALREIARLTTSYALGVQMLIFALFKIFAMVAPASLAPPSVTALYTTF